MICSSWPVPSVAVTSAWVSPRVKSAEPWLRGSTPTSLSMARTWAVVRPSIRAPLSRIWPRTMSFSSAFSVPSRMAAAPSSSWNCAAVPALAAATFSCRLVLAAMA